MIQAGFVAENLPHWDALDVALSESGERNPVRAEFSLAAHASDRAMHARVTPSRARQARASAVAARGAAPGLVSVPTTPTGGLSAPLAAAEVAANGAALQKELGAFALDAAKLRFSHLRMSVGFAARAHAVSEKGARSDVAWMVTLTYAGDNSDWRAEHLTRAMDAMRRWCGRKGFAMRYVWVAELQQRGVIHYHAVFWLPLGVSMPQWDRKGFWPHGMTNTLKAKHATGYLMAYLKKGDLESRGSLPKGARNYGVGGLDHSLRRARRWLRLPAFVRGNSSIWDNWKRATGGGWISPEGECFASEFAQVFVAGVRCLRRVCTHAVGIQANGPFSWLGDRAVALSFH